MSDFIEKQIELNAPLSRVWQALTDYRQFGTWFRIELEGPFVAAKITHSRSTRRVEAFRMHESGWTAQLANIEKHVTGHSEAALRA